MNTRCQIKFVEPLKWKAKDENLVDQHLVVFVNPLVEWFDEISMPQVGSLFVPVYFLDWLNSQLLHGTFHKEATVHAVFCVEKMQPPDGTIEDSDVVVNITSVWTPDGRTTTFKVPAIDFSCLLYNSKFIYSWGHKTLFASQAKEYMRCINANGESLWMDSLCVLRKEGDRPVLFSTAFYPVNWAMQMHVISTFEEALRPYRRAGPVSSRDQVYRQLLDLFRFKLTNSYPALETLKENFSLYDLVYRTYRVAIAQCGPEDGDIFVVREWLQIIDALNSRLFNAVHQSHSQLKSEEVTHEKG